MHGGSVPTLSAARHGAGRRGVYWWQVSHSHVWLKHFCWLWVPEPPRQLCSSLFDFLWQTFNNLDTERQWSEAGSQQLKVHLKPNKCNSEVLQRVNMHEVFLSQHFAEQFCQMSAPVLKTLKVMLAHAQQPLALNEKWLNCFQQFHKWLHWQNNDNTCWTAMKITVSLSWKPKSKAHQFNVCIDVAATVVLLGHLKIVAKTPTACWKTIEHGTLFRPHVQLFSNEFLQMFFFGSAHDWSHVFPSRFFVKNDNRLLHVWNTHNRMLGLSITGSFPAIAITQSACSHKESENWTPAQHKLSC